MWQARPDGGKDRANTRKGGRKFWACLDSKVTSDCVTDLQVLQCVVSAVRYIPNQSANFFVDVKKPTVR